jgi:hypothetical protein
MVLLLCCCRDNEVDAFESERGRRGRGRRGGGRRGGSCCLRRGQQEKRAQPLLDTHTRTHDRTPPPFTTPTRTTPSQTIREKKEDRALAPTLERERGSFNARRLPNASTHTPGSRRQIAPSHRGARARAEGGRPGRAKRERRARGAPPPSSLAHDQCIPLKALENKQPSTSPTMQGQQPQQPFQLPPGSVRCDVVPANHPALPPRPTVPARPGQQWMR